MNVLVGGRHRSKTDKYARGPSTRVERRAGCCGEWAEGGEGVLVLGEARQPQSCDLWPSGTWWRVEAGSL